MGNLSFKASMKSRNKSKEEPTLHDFRVLQTIGKGAFGKVCIIQKKDTKHLYGLKYMSKKTIVERSACRNVLKELEILKILNHPFLVNLNYSFQDNDHLYLVLDLMSGGDIRYHLNQGHVFTEAEIIPYIVEIGLALEYLRTKRIVHRDVKPDNLLLDSKGHIHLTDFDMATWIPDGKFAVSCSGTKSYMAPEIFATDTGKLPGYSFEVDWWSLGVTLHEMVTQKLPFAIKNRLVSGTILRLQEDGVLFHSRLGIFSHSMYELIKGLLKFNMEERLCSIGKLLENPVLRNVDITAAEKKLIDTKFAPNRKLFNCDPTHELEERMMEANLLGKKTKQIVWPADEVQGSFQLSIETLSNNFKPFRRSKCFTSENPLVHSLEMMHEETVEVLSNCNYLSVSSPFNNDAFHGPPPPYSL